MKAIVFLLGGLLCCHGFDERFLVAMRDIRREAVAEQTLVEEGEIPSWMDGTFIRHGCGAFGEVVSVGSGLQDEGFYNHIDHLFDCFGTGTNFKLQDGGATFTNKFWQTAIHKVYQEFNNNMNDSRAFPNTVLGRFDYERNQELRPNVTSHVTNLVPEEYPQVTFWQVGDLVTARTEGSTGQWINVHSVEGLGRFNFDGEDPWSGGFPMVNPAHEQTDRDGTVWSMTGMYRPNGQNTGTSEWVIYKVAPSGSSVSVVTRHVLGTYDLAKCPDNDLPYPDLDDRTGYMHAFGMSEQYVVLPQTSWLTDPCSLWLRGAVPSEPFFRGNIQWYGAQKSKLIVIRKSDGEHMGTVETEAFFVTHMLNTYEKDGKIIMDLIVYPNSEVYTKYTRLEYIVQNDWPESRLERMEIDIDAWTVTRTSLRSQPESKIEFSQFNWNYNTFPYQYGYFVENPYMLQGAIVKINVDTGAEVRYDFPEGVLPFEPWFVSTPGGTQEDDGVLLVQGLDTTREKAVLVILDARTMAVKAQVLAPELSLIGIHNKYYPCDVGGSSSGDTSACLEVHDSAESVIVSMATLIFTMAIRAAL